MTLNLTTLRPGYLVSLKTALTGNVTYRRFDIETEHLTEAGDARAKWETEKTVVNPAELDAGTKARSLARTAVTRVCSPSSFGLLCPENRRDELDAAMTEARAIADKFNAIASDTALFVAVIVGRVASDDVEAVRAINEEVRGLLRDMETGIRKLDVKAVRDAANSARALGQMLSPDAASRVQAAIDAARTVARRMVKAGEQAAQEIDSGALARIANARLSFLDLEEPAPIVPFNERAEGRAIDLGPDGLRPDAIDADTVIANVSAGLKATTETARAIEL